MTTEDRVGSDPASELVDFEPAVGGSSPDDDFEIKVEDWPDGSDKSEFTDAQKKIVRDWLVSDYTRFTNENFESLASGKDYSPATVRVALYRAFEEELDQEDISEAAELSIGIWAYEGADSSSSELAKKYPLAKSTLYSHRESFPQTIERLEGQIDKEALNKKLDEYDGYSQSRRTESKTLSPDQVEALKEEIKENPNWDDPDEIISNLDFSCPRQLPGSYKGNMVQSGALPAESDLSDKQSQLSQVNQSKDGGYLELKLRLSESDVSSILNDNDKVVNIKEKVVSALMR